VPIIKSAGVLHLVSELKLADFRRELASWIHSSRRDDGMPAFVVVPVL
jgi:hypothetical protein